MKTAVPIILALLAVPVASRESYDLLRSDPEGFARVEAGRALEFPRDHMPHPGFRSEWWYLTANLSDRDGTDYGVQWTLFRQSASASPDPGGWSSTQMWMAHAALSTPGGHLYEERFARGGIGQAGVEIGTGGQFAAWMDDWQLTGRQASPVPGELEFRLGDVTLQLTLEADTPWVLQGDDGYSRKSALGQASYYYSQPHITARGRLSRGQAAIPVTGVAWLDREWSSQPLAPDQPGWDWLSLHLDDGHALMVYRLRHRDGNEWLSGSWISPSGEVEALGTDDLVFRPLASRAVKTETGTREMPLVWQVALPDKRLQWRVEARSPDHWLAVAFPYWEGPVTATGTGGGRGYLELTGY